MSVRSTEAGVSLPPPRARGWQLSVLIWACASLAGCSCNTVRDPGGPGTLPDGGSTPLCQGASLARCGGECVNLDADARHCGGCGIACPTGGTCQYGACECPDHTTLCGDVCADLQIDADHCGSCDTACAPGFACTGGKCVEQCPSGLSRCDAGLCVDEVSDPLNCGGCGFTCKGGRTCQNGKCDCLPGQTLCDGACADLQSDPTHCGTCGTSCFAGSLCEEGQCICPPERTLCTTACVDTATDPNNCGGCDMYCVPGQTCTHGYCETPCPAGFTKCGGDCVDTSKSGSNCGACGHGCGLLSCQAGACVICDSNTTDCDNDGWKVSDGDCCDQPGSCGNPAMVNPGAVEVVGDGVDNNCNGLVDAADTLDTQPCDVGLASNSSTAEDYAKALGICRTTVENPPLNARTWGLISAQLLRADGSVLAYADAKSIRDHFGYKLKPVEGSSLVVIGSGIASDGVQTNPGPNGGPMSTSVQQSSSVDIQNCTLPYCIKDWFSAPNPPLKLANRLPEAPGCTGSGVGVNTANDSVMLVLRLRAPTNARALQFRGYFLSSEYPEYVCTTYNDQLIALIDTNAPPLGAVNPADKNLMTYNRSGKKWPIGINVASGTSLFKVCESQTQNATCWDSDVSSLSCANGAADLAGTGFEQVGGAGSCTNGGGTGWLTTTGNVRGGEIVELRIAVWDVGDEILDSLALLDGFQWLFQATNPGTTD